MVIFQKFQKQFLKTIHKLLGFFFLVFTFMHTHIVEFGTCWSNGGIANNLTNVILRSLMVNGGLTMEEISNKLIPFGSNGVVVFIGAHNGVTTQIAKRQPFSCLLSIGCTSDKLSLANIFHAQSLVHKLECHNPTLRECEDETHIPETWESTGTLETSEFDCKGQNTLHCGIFYIIGKLSKRRY